MNLYDTKTISCSNCGKCIGELDYDSEVTRPMCGKCANPLPEGDNAIYTINAIKAKVANSSQKEKIENNLILA